MSTEARMLAPVVAKKTSKRPLWSQVERHGIWKAFVDAGIRFANRYVFFQILKGVAVGRLDSRFLACDDKYRGKFISRATLLGLTCDDVNEIDVAFLDRALQHDDECYGFFEGNDLAAYSWYSNQPTESEVPGLRVHFNRQYIYMYKGYTHRDHRGQRLYAMGITRALDSYLKRGYQGLVAYIAWHNSDSLKACYRAGFRDFGNLYIIRIFGRYYFYNGKGCSKYGFALKRDQVGMR